MKLQRLLILTACITGLSYWPHPNRAIAQPAPVSSSATEALARAESLDEQVLTLYQQGKYAEGLPLAQESLAIREAQLEANHPDIANSLNNLAALYSGQADYAVALSLYERALSINEAAFGENHNITGISVNNLASAYEAQGNYDRAIPLYERAIAIWETDLGPEDPNVAIALNNLAGSYRLTGNYERALSLAERSLSIRQAAFGPAHSIVATGLHNLALIYQTKGDYTTAIPLYEQALSIRRAAFGENSPPVAFTLGSIGVIYAEQGNYPKAEPLLEQAIAVLESSSAENAADLANMLSNLGTIYISQKKYAAVLPLLERALSIWETTLGRDHPQVGLGLGNLASLYSSRNDYGPAIALYKRSLAVLEAAFEEPHPTVASTINNLALVYERQGDTAAAIPLYERSLAMMQAVVGANHPNVASTLTNLGLLYRRSNNLDRAIELLQAANAVAEYNLANTLASASEDRRQKYIKGIEGSTNWNVSIHLNDALSASSAETQPIAAKLALTTIFQRKGRILDAVANTSQQLRARLSPAEQSIFDELNAVRAELSNLRFSESDGPIDEDYTRQISTLETRAEELDEALARQSAAFSAASEEISIEAIRAEIPADAALVEFVRYFPYSENSTTSWLAPHYAAYVLTQRGDIQAVDLGDAEAIDQQVAGFRRSLSTRGNVKAIARQLDEQLMAPLRPFLSNKSHLLLSPDSQLNLIPFDALVDAQDRYLVETYEISYLNSGRDLRRLQLDTPSRQPPVIMADPNYEGASSGSGDGRRSVDAESLRFNPLPGTAAEGEAIAALLPSATLLTQQQATESALKQVSAPSILHIATHGFFLPDVVFVVPEADSRGASLSVVSVEAPAQVMPSNLENPLLRSGLALAGVNTRNSGGEDGIFTALEASGLDLYGTQLVVLSACETGVGAASSGEGVYGLRRAFDIAGAESQLMSLWQVDDTGTSELMQLYYQNLMEKNQGRSEALRNAQLEMMETDTYAHPYYWSSFIFSGDWRPLE